MSKKPSLLRMLAWIRRFSGSLTVAALSTALSKALPKRMARSMGASRFQIFRYIKFPSSLPQFFSGLRIAAAYSVVGAVISEWLGGFGGLGVYMTRVRKAFAFDKMFAVIFLTAIISLLLMGIVDIAERWCMPYRNIRENDK